MAGWVDEGLSRNFQNSLRVPLPAAGRVPSPELAGLGTASAAGTGRFGSSKRGRVKGEKRASGRLKHLCSEFSRPNFVVVVVPPSSFPSPLERHLLNIHSQPRWEGAAAEGISAAAAAVEASPQRP